MGRRGPRVGGLVLSLFDKHVLGLQVGPLVVLAIANIVSRSRRARIRLREQVLRLHARYEAGVPRNFVVACGLRHRLLRGRGRVVRVGLRRDAHSWLARLTRRRKVFQNDQFCKIIT